MSLFQKIKIALSSPYPYKESIWDEMKSLIVAAFIVGFILYAFEPFGLSFYEGSKVKVCLLFMGVTLIVGIVHSFIGKKLLEMERNPEKLTFGRWILSVLSLILFIAIGNFLVNVFFLDSQPDFINFIGNVISTILIGIFPVTLFGFQHLLKMEKINTQKALELNQQLYKTTTPSEKEIILAIQAMENYVIIYKSEGHNLTKTTERRTLQSATRDPQFKDLLKCHRSFLVNPQYVRDVKGNAQGLKLKMMHPECPIIPVSRSLISRVKEVLKDKKSH